MFSERYNIACCALYPKKVFFGKIHRHFKEPMFDINNFHDFDFQKIKCIQLQFVSKPNMEIKHNSVEFIKFCQKIS